MLTEERTGAWARQRIYWWSRDPKLLPQVAAIVIALCVEVIAEQYFDQAIVRLAWLAQHGRNSIHRDARRALGELSKGSRLRKVVELLLAGSRFDAETFAAVSLPQDSEAVHLISADPQLHEQFMDGWRRVLEGMDGAQRKRTLTNWLATLADLQTAGSEATADESLRLLMTVCSRRADLNSLFNACQDWAAADVGELEIERRIRAVQPVEAEIIRTRRQHRTQPQEVRR